MPYHSHFRHEDKAFPPFYTQIGSGNIGVDTIQLQNLYKLLQLNSERGLRPISMMGMKQLHKTFWARHIAYGIYGFLAVLCFMLYNSAESYSKLSNNVDSAMMQGLEKDNNQLAIIRPDRKPDSNRFDLASLNNS